MAVNNVSILEPIDKASKDVRCIDVENLFNIH